MQAISSKPIPRQKPISIQYSIIKLDSQLTLYEILKRHSNGWEIFQRYGIEKKTSYRIKAALSYYGEANPVVAKAITHIINTQQGKSITKTYFELIDNYLPHAPSSPARKVERNLLKYAKELGPNISELCDIILNRYEQSSLITTIKNMFKDETDIEATKQKALEEAVYLDERIRTHTTEVLGREHEKIDSATLKYLEQRYERKLFLTLKRCLRT